MIKALYHTIKNFFVDTYNYYKYTRRGIIDISKYSDLTFNKTILFENTDHKQFLDKIDMKIMEDFLKNYDIYNNKEYWFPIHSGGGTKITHSSSKIVKLNVLKNRFTHPKPKRLKFKVKIK